MRKTATGASFGEQVVRKLHAERIAEAAVQAQGNPIVLEAQRRQLEAKMRDVVEHRAEMLPKDKIFFALKDAVLSVIRLDSEIKSSAMLEECLPPASLIESECARMGSDDPAAAAQDMFKSIRDDADVKYELGLAIDATCRHFAFARAMALFETGHHFPEISNLVLDLGNKKGYQKENLEKYVRLLEADPAMYREAIAEQIPNDALREAFVTLYASGDPWRLLEEFERHPSSWRPVLDAHARKFLEYILPKMDGAHENDIRSALHAFFQNDLDELEAQAAKRERNEAFTSKIAKEAALHTDDLLHRKSAVLGLAPDRHIATPEVDANISEDEIRVIRMVLGGGDHPLSERTDTLAVALPSKHNVQGFVEPKRKQEGASYFYDEHIHARTDLSETSRLAFIGPLRQVKDASELRELKNTIVHVLGHEPAWLDVRYASLWAVSAAGRAEKSIPHPDERAMIAVDHGIPFGVVKSTGEIGYSRGISNGFDRETVLYYPMVVLPGPRRK